MPQSRRLKMIYFLNKQSFLWWWNSEHPQSTQAESTDDTDRSNDSIPAISPTDCKGGC